MKTLRDYLIIALVVLATCLTLFPAHAGQSRPKTHYTAQELRAEVQQAIPGISASERDAAVWIILRESGGNIHAWNPSTAGGLIGFKTVTWRNITSRSGGRLKYTLQPPGQIKAMEAYVKGRYGTFAKAKAHHLKTRRTVRVRTSRGWRTRTTGGWY